MLRHRIAAWRSLLFPLKTLQRKVITCFYSKVTYLFDKESWTELIVSLKDSRGTKSNTNVNNFHDNQTPLVMLTQKSMYPLRKLCKFTKTEVGLYIYSRKECIERLAIQSNLFLFLWSIVCFRREWKGNWEMAFIYLSLCIWLCLYKCAMQVHTCVSICTRTQE